MHLFQTSQPALRSGINWDLIRKELLFWLHTYIIIAGVFMGLVLPLWLVVTVVILHRLHLKIFNGCIVSHWQQKAGDLKHTENFLQQLTFRATNKTISKHQAKRIDQTIISLSVLVSVLVYFGFSSEVVFYGLLVSIGLIGYFSLQTAAPKISSCENVCINTRSVLPKLLRRVNLSLLGFFTALIIAAVHISLNDPYVLMTCIAVCSVGSVYFIFLQVFHLKSFCQQCMNLHGTMFFSCGLSLFSVLT